MKDRRFALKVKVKSLAAEARIIRFEERKSKCQQKIAELHSHRVGTVRSEARHTLIAYGFLRGRKYSQIESGCKEEPNWGKIWKMVEKYGPCYDHGYETIMEYDKRKYGLKDQYDRWRK